ncbi:ABC transporter substrate-binding protein [bacterium]|nr:ABC transporter substrate-binding protein [candidate division CSSED10-310 bacterium]
MKLPNKILLILFALTTMTRLTGCVPAQVPLQYRKLTDIPAADIQQTLSEYQTLIRDHPGDPLIPRLIYNCGRLYLAIDQKKDAMRQFSLLSETDPDSTWGTAARIELTGLEEHSDPDAAIETLKSLKTRILDSAMGSRADYHIGEIQASRGNYREALNQYLHAMTFQTDPATSALVSLKIGLCHFKMNQLDKADTFLQKSLRTDRYHHPDPYILLAQLHLMRNSPLKSLQILFDGLNNLINPAPLEPEISGILSRFLTLEQLLEIERKLSLEDPELYLIRMERIRRLMESGQLDTAETQIEDLLRDYPVRASNLEADLSALQQRVVSDEYAIGLLIPLSGSLSMIGQNIYRGVRMALDEYYQTEPTLTIELIPIDTGGIPENALEGFLELAENPEVIAVIGPVKSSTTDAIIESAAKYHLPTITPGCPNDTICGQSEYLYRIYPSAYREGRMLLKFMSESMGYAKYGCVYPDIEYGSTACDGFIDAVSEFGGEIVQVIKYPVIFSNAANYLMNLKDAELEFIFLPDEAERAAQMAGQIRYQEILDPVIIGTGAWEDYLITQIAGIHLEGSFFITGYPHLTGARKTAADRYRLLYGETPDHFALRAYEACRILLNRLEPDVKYRERLNFLLSDSEGFTSLDGISKFDHNGDYLPPLTIFQIRNRHFVPMVRWDGSEFIPIETPEN